MSDGKMAVYDYEPYAWETSGNEALRERLIFVQAAKQAISKYGLPAITSVAKEVLFLNWTSNPIGDRDAYQGMAFAGWLIMMLIGGVTYLVAGVVIKPEPGSV